MITMEIETGDARPTVRQITSDSGITSEILREIPLARLAKYATLALEIGFGEGPIVDELASRLLRDEVLIQRVGSGQDGTYGVHVTDSPATRELWSEYVKIVAAAQQTGKRGRARITDELLRRVAAVYRQAIKKGRPPKKAVQAAEGVSLTQAGKYIMRAQERGFLGTTTAGKKGELPP